MDNTFLFQPLFRVKSGVMSTLQPDILVVNIVYINVYSAHLGSCFTLCGFFETGNIKFHQNSVTATSMLAENE